MKKAAIERGGEKKKKRTHITPLSHITYMTHPSYTHNKKHAIAKYVAEWFNR